MLPQRGGGAASVSGATGTENKPEAGAESGSSQSEKSPSESLSEESADSSADRQTGSEQPDALPDTLSPSEPAGDSAPETEGLADGLFVLLKTSSGDILFRLDYDSAPLAVSYFASLVEKKFFDGTRFFRDLSPHVIYGGPYRYREASPRHFDSAFPRTPGPYGIQFTEPGVLALPRILNYDRADFFMITKQAEPFLNGRYTPVGMAVQGNKFIRHLSRLTRIREIRLLRKGTFWKNLTFNRVFLERLIGQTTDRLIQNFQAEHPRAAALAQSYGKPLQISPDGSFFIRLTPGKGSSPEPGDSVTLNYKGFLPDGTMFDDSSSRGLPLGFEIGTRTVIPGWEQAVIRMKKGEKIILFLPPSLAYGEAGRPPVIPGNSWLIFELELMSIEPKSPEPGNDTPAE